MESQRQGLIHDLLSQRLRIFAGTDFAQSAWSRDLPPDSSRSELLRELAEIRGQLPRSTANDRMFAEPAFLAAAPGGPRAREWERSRAALVAALRGLVSLGIDLRKAGEALHASLAHTGEVALAIAVLAEASEVYGVDLEPAARIVSDAAFARFHRVEELLILADRLDHWVLKEAAYKSHPRSVQTIIADYFITARSNDGDFLIRCEKGGTIDFRATIGSFEGYRYAFARRI